MIAIAERKILRLTVMTALYIAQGIPYGFVTVTLAAYLAKHGASEGDIGDLAAFALLPWSFKWLWAPLVDRFSHSQMGRRRPFIITAQLMLVTTTLTLVFIPDPENNLGLVKGLIFTANVFASLQDVSVDALAVDLLPESERGFANGLMYGGSYLGTIFGGSILSILVGTYSLQAALVGQALALGTIMLFPLLLREKPGDKLFSLATRPRPTREKRSNLFALLLKAFRRRSPLLSAVLAIGVMLSTQTLTAVLTVLLVNKLGWSQEAYGNMTGGLPLLLGLTGSVAGGWLADRIGHKRMVAIASIALGLVYVVFGIGAQYWGDDNFILAYFCAQELCTGTLSAALFALLMGVAWPVVAASQFTAYMALLNLGRSLGGKLVGPLTDSLGTAGTFITLGCYQVVVILVLLGIDPNQNRRELGEDPG